MRQRRRSSRLTAPSVLATGSAATSARRNVATKCASSRVVVDLHHLRDALVVGARAGRDGRRPAQRPQQHVTARGVSSRDRMVSAPTRSSSASVT